MSSSSVELIPLSRIEDNPFQPRTSYDDEGIRALADDIRRRGLLQPPVGRRMGNAVQLAFGHRRLRAFRLLAEEDPEMWGRMPVRVRALSDPEMALAAWSENQARADLDPVERAEAIQRMITAFGWTQQEAAERLGMSRSAVANTLRLLQLPEEIKADLAEGRLSERQALAVLPVFSLPEPALEKARSSWQLRRLEHLLETRASSERLRAEVGGIIEAVTRDLQEAPFPLDQPVGGKETCNGCSLRMSNGRCAGPDCFDYKRTAWIEAALAGVAQQLGIGWVSLEEQERLRPYLSKWKPFSGQAAVEHGLQKGCSHLRLAYVQWDYEKRYPHPDGHPDMYFVCVGRGQCRCQKEAYEAQHPDEVAAERERIDRLTEIRSNAVAELAAALDQGRTEALRAVLAALSRPSERKKITGIQDRKTILEKLARAVLDSEIWWSNDPEVAARAYRAWAEQYGLGGLAAAGEKRWEDLANLRQRWERIQTWLNRLPDELPKPEAVRGNQANLLAMQGEILALNGNGCPEAETLYAEVSAALERLNELLPVVEMWDGEDFDRVAWLVNVPVGDPNFDPAAADDLALRYALALVRGREGHKARVAALERELKRRRNGQFQSQA